MIRIILADDQRLMTDGLKTILETRTDIQITGLAANGRQVLDILERSAGQADLVLLDVRMPEMDGVQAVRVIKETWPRLRVLMLTTFNDENYLLDALAGGADGYLLKDMETAELFAAIDQAMAGQLVLRARSPPSCGQASPGKRNASKTWTNYARPASARGRWKSQPCWPKATPTARSPPPCTCRTARCATTSAPSMRSWT
jgi:DNA-binding NarL/FixJ family response regulator